MSTFAICRGRFTSTPTVSFAQEPALKEWLSERVISAPLPPFPLAPIRREGAMHRTFTGEARRTIFAWNILRQVST